MADDNLQSALDELETVKDYYRRFEMNGLESHKYKETALPFIRAIQHLASEIEAMRDDT